MATSHQARMRFCLIVVVVSLLGVSGVAQGPANATKAAHGASVEGIVTKDPDGEPVKKVLIELIAGNQMEAGNYTAETGPDGSFRIENIVPGRYWLFAERNGFLDRDKNRGRIDGRVVALTEGQELKDVRIRLQAAAVIRGRVTDEDGEPMPNAEVSVMRQTFAGGHRRWEQAGSERTNDLGEYRIANLAAGNVYVSVNPPPDFKSLIEAGGNGGAQPSPPDKPSVIYQTTYYPGTSDRSQATAIQLHAGDEFPVNFSLTPSPSLSIRGAVVNLPPKTSATIMLQSRDFNLILNGAEIRKDGSFVIRNVSPGNYTIQATVEGSPVPMTAREMLQVGSTNVEGLRLAPRPAATVRGRLRVESNNAAKRIDPERIFLGLRPLDDDESKMGVLQASLGEGFSPETHVAADGSFEWNNVPPGRYYVQMFGNTGSNEDWFVKSVVAGGSDLNDAGISVNGGVVVLDLIASANGGVVDGVVTNEKGEPVPNAVIVAVPEARWLGREDRYRQTVSDQSGRFSLHGVRPGDYTLFAWDSVEGEEYYNPDFLRSYEGQGTPLHVGDGDRKALQMPALHGYEDSQE